jgi:hypothetical protein
MVTTSDMDWNSSHVVQGIDLTKLKHTLDGIDYTAVKKQKALYSRLYHEANVTHHSGKGMSFTEMLLLLAHYKLIVDRDALVYVYYRAFTGRLSLYTHLGSKTLWFGRRQINSSQIWSTWIESGPSSR